MKEYRYRHRILHSGKPSVKGWCVWHPVFNDEKFGLKWRLDSDRKCYTRGKQTVEFQVQSREVTEWKDEEVE